MVTRGSETQGLTVNHTRKNECCSSAGQRNSRTTVMGTTTTWEEEEAAAAAAAASPCVKQTRALEAREAEEEGEGVAEVRLPPRFPG